MTVPAKLVVTDTEALEMDMNDETSKHFCRYNGLLIVCHPDFPPHVWDGEKMTPLELNGETKPVYIYYDPTTGRGSVVNEP
jgi:hypothetical protein